MKLLEAGPFADYEVVEGFDGSVGRPLLVRGVFGRRDSKNENGRFYPTKVWTGVLKEGGEVQTRVHSRNFFGELDHPDDGRTLLQRTSHIVTELGFGKSNEIMGTAEVLPTPAGATLKGLFEARVLVGISSRGEGDVEETDNGAVVKENFQLQAFDFVHNPSTQGAYPRPLMAEHVRNSNGETLMDLMKEYRELEESVLELSGLKPSEVPPSVRPLVEKQANETMYRLSKIIESAGEHRPLFIGLLAEAQAARRGIVYPSKTTIDLGSLTEDALPAGPSVGPGGAGPLQNVASDALSKSQMKKMLGANKSANAGPSGKVEAEPETVSPGSIPLVPGASKQVPESKEKEEGKMAETKGVSTAFRNLVKEAEAELDKIEKEDAVGDDDKFAAETAGKVESRLLAKTRSFMEDGTGLAPPPYEKEDSKGMITLPEEGDELPVAPQDDTAPPPAAEPEAEETVEIPPPPADLVIHLTPEGEGTPGEEEGEPLPPMEAKLSKSFRKIVREAKLARYERKVTEIIAAKAISKLSKRVRAAESRRHPAAASFVEANGKKIPVAQAGKVIESLVAKYKGLQKSLEEGKTTNESVGADGPFATSKVRNISRLNEDTFRETGRRASSGSKGSTLDHQAELGAKVASRIGRY